MSAVKKDVGYLPMAKLEAVNYLEIRCDCVCLFRRVRLLAVFIEGRDLGSMDRESLT